MATLATSSEEGFKTLTDFNNVEEYVAWFEKNLYIKMKGQGQRHAMLLMWNYVELKRGLGRLPNDSDPAFVKTLM